MQFWNSPGFKYSIPSFNTVVWYTIRRQIKQCWLITEKYDFQALKTADKTMDISFDDLDSKMDISFNDLNSKMDISFKGLDPFSGWEELTWVWAPSEGRWGWWREGRRGSRTCCCPRCKHRARHNGGLAQGRTSHRSSTGKFFYISMWSVWPMRPKARVLALISVIP